MTNPSLAPKPVHRLLSLDVLRGITIAFMIMVNNNSGPGSWRFMNHAAWNGLTPTDLVYPTFLFLVGASIVFAVEARLARGATRAELAWHTVRRAGILFLLGIVVNAFPSFALAHLRIYGVLQRIAICYLVVGLFYLWEKRVWIHVVALVVALVGYWVLVRWVPVPGAGLPGRDIPFMDPSTNIVNWLDRLMIPHHLGESWPDYNLRETQGMLSNIPAVGTTLVGLLTALWLRGRKTVAAKTLGLAAASAGCVAIGYIWQIWFPLNKRMWTSSFVLVSAGWSLVVFALIYWAVEQRGWGKDRGKGWVWPWLVLGSNAIVAYMFSELLANGLWSIHFTADGKRTDVLLYTFTHVFTRNIPNPGWAAFAYSVSFLAVCFLPVWFLYRKRIFVKV
jgi:predicted acyltransferase